MNPEDSHTDADESRASRWAHFRRWGLLWIAAATAALLIASTAWVRSGIAAHADELAGVHADFMLSHRDETESLEQQFAQMRPFGAWAITLFDYAGVPQQTLGAPVPVSRAPDGPVSAEHGRYRIEQVLPGGVMVVEYVPMLAIDLKTRATQGFILSVVASVLLVLFVALWIGYRLRIEAMALEAERTHHLAQLGTLSAVIAHELRNPLTVLMGHVQLLVEDLPDSRSLRHVEAGAHRLDELLSSLLLFARTGEVERTPTDPVALLRGAAAAAGLRLDAVSGNAPRWRLDEVRMGQVLQNLIANALIACPDGEVVASVRAESGALVYDVRDHGRGIPAGMHEQIFEPFHTTRAQGSGLGLAVARAIVEKHGGTLTAHDVPGGGALFSARIPA